jgi:hypothetical protein
MQKATKERDEEGYYGKPLFPFENFGDLMIIRWN